MITAVEWLLQQVNGFSWADFRIDIPKEIIEQAKEMEKKQMEDAWVYCRANYDWDKSFKQYYNKTYNR